MVWIRRVRTASGATAVQLAEYVDARRRIVRHVGSAHDELELGLLMGEARRLLADDAQGELDPVARRDFWQGCCVSPEGESETWEDHHRSRLRRRPGSC